MQKEVWGHALCFYKIYSIMQRAVLHFHTILNKGKSMQNAKQEWICCLVPPLRNETRREWGFYCLWHELPIYKGGESVIIQDHGCSKTKEWLFPMTRIRHRISSKKGPQNYQYMAWWCCVCLLMESGGRRQCLSVTVRSCTLNKTNHPLENECPVPLCRVSLYLYSPLIGLYFRSKKISSLLR